MDAMDKTIYFKATAQQHNDLSALAKAEQLTKSDIVRRAVKLYLAGGAEKLLGRGEGHRLEPHHADQPHEEGGERRVIVHDHDDGWLLSHSLPRPRPDPLSRCL